MSERNKLSKRVLLPASKQQVLMLSIQQKLVATPDDLAKIAGVHPRTIRDWKRGRFLISFSALRKLCNKANISLPKKLKLVEPFWYTRNGGSAGGKAIMKKYGHVGGDPENRKNKWHEWWKQTGKFKKHPIINVSLPFKKPQPSNNLAEFIGLMMGDGGMSQSQICITLHHIDDREYAQYVMGLMKKLFGIEPSFRHDTKNSVNRLTISRSGLVKYLNSLGVVVGNKIKQQFDIPDWIKYNNGFLKSCIKGLIDTDGSIFDHRYKVNGKWYLYKKLAFTSASPPLITSVFIALKKRGFQPRITNSGKEVRLDRQKDILNYFEIIKSSNPKHLKRYKTML